ncbi:hypothetical protein [Pseudoduganella sp. UC29_71]|uniref:hypothetical protein n=1 Tax=Pseudoduganella sp. UC29_71 TaxID=3350174 RepID=UPI00366C4247
MGCCGSRRQQVVQKIYGAQGYGAADGVRASAAQGVHGPASGAPASAPQFAAPPGVAFVYDGMRELVVTGGVTGRRYRFTARGARLLVDALDAPAMRQTPKLRCLA